MSVRILVGDARALLATLPEKSVQCVITSPPYFGLRSYSTNPQLWGGDQSGACEHAWGEERHVSLSGGVGRSTLYSPGDKTPGAAAEKYAAQLPKAASQGAHCLRCGCWRGELGSEPDPDSFVRNLVEVFAAVKRVLRDDGLLFCNLGDSYAGSGKGGQYGPNSTLGNQRSDIQPGDRQGFTSRYTAGDLPAKSLLMMPARVTLALQGFATVPGAALVQMADALAEARRAGDWFAVEVVEGALRTWAAMSSVFDGWILRSCMPWIKASAMPESVQDRPSSALEYVFMFSKKARYFYDATAVRQTAEYGRRSAFRSTQYINNRSHENGAIQVEPITVGGADPSAGRAFRNTDLFRISVDDRIDALEAEVKRLKAQRDAGGLFLDEDGDPLALDVNPAAYAQAHFATYPPRLVEPLIKAGTSERGACPNCGAAWIRTVVGARKPWAELGSALREAREAAGLTPADVAQQAELPSVASVGDWEEGGHIPSARHWERIAPILGIAADRSEFLDQATYEATYGSRNPKASRDATGMDAGQQWNAHRTLAGVKHVETTGWAPSCPCPPAERIAPRLIEPLIKAGTSEKGACSSCGSPWARVVERERHSTPVIPTTAKGQARASGSGYYPPNSQETGGVAGITDRRTLSWRQSCPCPPEPVPCVVMDIFSGAGTTGLVASRLGRDYIGLELSPVYAAMSEARIRDDAPLLADVVTAGPAEYAPLELFGEITA